MKKTSKYANKLQNKKETKNQNPLYHYWFQARMTSNKHGVHRK